MPDESKIPPIDTFQQVQNLVAYHSVQDGKVTKHPSFYLVKPIAYALIKITFSNFSGIFEVFSMCSYVWGKYRRQEEWTCEHMVNTFCLTIHHKTW